MGFFCKQKLTFYRIASVSFGLIISGGLSSCNSVGGLFENPPTGPSSPSHLAASPASGAIYLSWAAASGSGSVFYTVKRSTSATAGFVSIAGNIQTTSYIDRSVTNGVTYYYLVTATDNNGTTSTVVISAVAQGVSVTFSNSPAASIVNPNNVTHFVLEGTCNPSDAIVQLSGAVVGSIPCSHVGKWSKSFDLSGLHDSVFGYLIYADLNDAFGNKASQASLIITKGTQSPTISISSPSNFSYVIPSQYTSYTVSGSCSSNNDILDLEASDGQNSVHATPPCNTQITPNYSAIIDLNSLGSNIILITSEKDFAGNISYSNPISIHKAISIRSPQPKSYINSLNAKNFEVLGDCYGNQTVKLQVDGTPPVGQTGGDCNGSTFSAWMDTTGFSEGNHQITAAVYDSDGNSITTSPVTVIKDITPPTITFLKPTSTTHINYTNQSNIVITGSCSEDGMLVLVKAAQSNYAYLTVDPLPCSRSSSPNWNTSIDVSSLADGALTFTATHQDIAGNLSTATITVSKLTSFPSVTITNLTPNYPIHNGNNSTHFTVSGTCSSTSLGQTAYVKVDGGFSGTGTCDGAKYSATFDSTVLTNSGHAIQVLIYDFVGNPTQTAPLYVQKDVNAKTLLLSGISNSVVAGSEQTLILSAVDSSGFVAKDYRGTVALSTSDSLASLPAVYTFENDDAGIHIFTGGVIFNSPGVQFITAKDTSSTSITGSLSSISVISINQLLADFSFYSGSDSLYQFDSSLIEISLEGKAQLKTLSQVDQDGSSSGFGGGTLNGVIFDSSQSYLKLSNSTPSNTSSLDSTWTPAYSNLIQYWQLDGTGSISDEDSVPATIGDSAIALNSDDAGLSFVSPGKVNSAVSFDGIDDEMIIEPSQSVSGHFTVSFWIYPTEFNSEADPSISQRTLLSTIASGDLGFNAYLSVAPDNTAVLAAQLSTASDSLGSISSPRFVFDSSSIRHWYHVVYSVSPTLWNLYINGQGVGSGTINGIPILYDPSHPITLGTCSQCTHSNAYAGLMDEVAVWNVSLSATQVQSIYQRQSASYSGSITSRVMDVGSLAANSAIWNSLSWTPSLPFFKNLTSQGNSEDSSSYSDLGTQSLMSGNIGLWHFDDTSGSTLQDDSGNNNSGSIHGNISLAQTGKLGQSMSFDGSPTSYIQIPHSATLALTGDLTIIAWIFPIQVNDSGLTILSKTNGDIAAPFNYSLSASSGIPVFSLGDGSHSSSLVATSAPPTGDWSLVAITKSGSTISHYLNGKANGSGTLDGTLSDVGLPMSIGVRNNFSSPFYGNLDEIAVWNRALNSSEIQQIYNRAANRIQFQIRSCATNPCTSEGWMGPDGSSQSYFSELNNTDSTQVPGNSYIQLPHLSFSNFSGLTVSPNRAFQYRAILESDVGGEGAGPTLKNVSIGPDHYTSSAPSISNKIGIPFSTLNQFTETLGSKSCSSGIKYQLSSDQNNWYYILDGAWVLSSSNTDMGQASSALDIQNFISNYSTQVGSGNLYFRAFLQSNGSQACELDDLRFSGEN